MTGERCPLLARPLVLLVKLYRLTLSPYIGGSCRFHPSCSLYALEALSRFGAARGSALTALRILRCNPFCEGGLDPVPSDGALRWRRSAAPGTETPSPRNPRGDHAADRPGR